MKSKNGILWQFHIKPSKIRRMIAQVEKTMEDKTKYTRKVKHKQCLLPN